MKRRKYTQLWLVAFILLSTLFFLGCRDIGKRGQQNIDRGGKLENSKLQAVEEVAHFSSINGFKVEKGRFYFSGVEDEYWKFYSIDLSSRVVQDEHQEVGNFDLFIPLEGKNAIYVDMDGQLFYRKNNRDEKIDEGVMGVYSPNVLMAPNKKGILYTKGTRQDASLYRYMLGEKEPLLIKERISEEAFYTFSYTTHWSNEKNYFVFDNQELYDEQGKLVINIGGTASKWSPDDRYIAFIKRPFNLEESKIFIGDWISYIGKEFRVFDMENKREEKIYESSEGLIDAIDSIQWSKDSSKVAISLGEIIQGSGGELESLDYQSLFIYDMTNQKKYEIEQFPYNFYAFLFNNSIYGSSLGKRDVVEVIKIEEEVRKKYDKPILLNSKDMFIISYQGEAYLMNGRDLIKIDSNGGERILMHLPWDVDEVYFDSHTRQLIIINQEQRLFLLKV